MNNIKYTLKTKGSKVSRVRRFTSRMERSSKTHSIPVNQALSNFGAELIKSDLNKEFIKGATYGLLGLIVDI